MRNMTVLGFVVVLVALVVAPAQAVGQGVATPFEATDVACPGGNIVLSEDGLIAGTSTVVVTPIDEKRFLVDAVYFPTAYPGSTWVAPGQGHFTSSGFIVHHSGYGTGVFEGAKIKFNVQPLQDPGELPCDPVGPVVRLKGVIVQPPGQTAE